MAMTLNEINQEQIRRFFRMTEEQRKRLPESIDIYPSGKLTVFQLNFKDGDIAQLTGETPLDCARQLVVKLEMREK